MKNAGHHEISKSQWQVSRGSEKFGKKSKEFVSFKEVSKKDPGFQIRIRIDWAMEGSRFSLL